MISWEEEESYLCFNPRMPVEDQRRLLVLRDVGRGYVWVATSGSSDFPKWVALSKRAILISAEAVNCHLGSDGSDIWLHVLPDFHVGGIGIRARAYLSGARVVELNSRWDPLLFYEVLKESGATLCSLVPAQVFDLVAHRLYSPERVRAVIVGGGALDEGIYCQAKAYGWRVLPSYGLTECASQVATARLGSGDLHLLSHVQVKISDEGLIKIKSDSLLSAYAIWVNGEWQISDPKVNGWLTTEDRGSVLGERLVVEGRGGKFLKIGGENSHLGRLESVLEQERLALGAKEDMALIAVPDTRLGHVIHLVMTGENEGVVRKYQESVLPFERIRQIHYVREIPRSPLGKLLKGELSACLKISL